MILEIRTAKITSKGQIAIPKEIRKNKQFKDGEKIAILAYPDRIELRPLKRISKNMETAIASEKALSKEWNSNEDEEAWKAL